MKQINLFGEEVEQTEGKYTAKVTTPVYEPSHAKPNVLELYDRHKTVRLIAEIDASAVPEDEKEFLRAAASRHTVFNYERIADYYAHSGPELQRLMEHSALVIIDFEKAIELGYIRLCEDIRKQYLEDYDA